MERSEVLSKLIACCDIADKENISEKSNLKFDLKMDSVSLLYLVLSLEEVFKVSFDETSFNEFVTVGDVVDYILSKMN